MTMPRAAKQKIVEFTRMADSTPADYALVDAWAEQFRSTVADRVLDHYASLKGTSFAHKLDTYDHGLQTATRAFRAGADEEMVVIALLHDIGVGLAPDNHGAASAEIMRPFISDTNYWLVRHHDMFQSYYYRHHYGEDRNLRDRYRGHPAYELTVDFCERWDQCSFDPDFDTLPIATFEPMIRRLFAQKPRPVWT